MCKREERERENVMKEKEEGATPGGFHFSFADSNSITRKIKQNGNQLSSSSLSTLLVFFFFLFPLSAMASKRISKVRIRCEGRENEESQHQQEGKTEAELDALQRLSSLSGRASHRALPLRRASFDRRCDFEATLHRVFDPWTTSLVTAREGFPLPERGRNGKKEGKKPSREPRRIAVELIEEEACLTRLPLSVAQ